MLASWLSLAFQENSENSREERNIEKENFEALWHVATMGEIFKETLQGLWRNFSPFALVVIIINDFEKTNKLKKRLWKKKLSNLLKLSNW
jgi:hypothetical protein